MRCVAPSKHIEISIDRPSDRQHIRSASATTGWSGSSLDIKSTECLMCSAADPPLTNFFFQVNWHAASAFDPPSYAHLLERPTTVVHTLGILFENSYKSVFHATSAVDAVRGLTGLRDTGNPLAEHGGKRSDHGEMSYNRINRDTGEARTSAYVILKLIFHAPPSLYSR